MSSNLTPLYRGPLAQANGILPLRMRSREADILSLAIGYQESKYLTRQQRGGPARGFHQQERPSVKRIMVHRASRQPLMTVCAAREIPFDDASIYDALLSDDVLDFAMARLLLWTDPAPVPETGDEEGAWAYYMRVWRPGKPRHDDWHESYSLALKAVQP